jgi:protein TonB
MKEQRLGIVISLAIHACFLLLFLTIQVANAIPYTKTIFISFTQQDTSPGAAQKETKTIAQPRAEKVHQASKPELMEIKQRQEEVVVKETPVLSVSKKADNHPPVKAEIASLGKAENQGISETVFGNFGAPAFIHREIPVYPYLAKRFGKEGKVALKLLIDKNGNVQEIEIIESLGFGFTEAAVDAIKKSTFAPAHRNGEKIVSRAILSVRFILK